ncbi:copper amine oxidase N-terminal domain-containing protein [Anaerotignum sp.]|uniref:copper amine oxidase N-terminal domain-containing protein n=1 Tax=Anaerotignum sp. TaxID=2039241 RepID=UPI0029D67356|nr:copper amine oxidase N-terminal domain-containing protein [Anaerotignum sp.]MCI6056781.1 copper amine oxidase N-terminal domain-containing protein [Clostridia bacterium]MDY3595688.1 copper amine oxidase N-terminal domain-containing protein [Anaerotignum sp.]
MKKVLLMTILASLTFPSVALGMNGAGITGEISIGNDEEKTRIMYMSQYHHMGYRCLPQGELIIRWPLGAEDETLYFALEAPVDPSMTADGESFLDIYDVKDGEIEYLSDNSFAVTGTDMQTKITMDWSLPKTGLKEKTDLVLRVSENKDIKNAKTIPFMKIMPRDTPDAVWHASSWNIEEKEYVEKSDVLMQKMFTYRQENGTYMIPGRFWIEEFSRRGGMEWQWNSKDKSFHVFKNEKEYIFTAGQNYVSVNGQKFYFMATPEIVDGRIYIPLDMMKLMWKDESEVIELDGKIQLVVCV